MKIYHYSLQELGVKTIDLGKRGENKVREIEFDLRDWIAEYPGASVALYVSQPNTTVYLATTNMVDGVLRWPIIDTYTAIPGFGDAEIVLSGTDGERLKSVTASIFVSDSLSDGAPGEAPDYMRPYVDQVAENAAKVEEALEEIKNIGLQSGNMPTGGSTGQFLAKKSAENYDAHWIDPPSGSGTGGGVADSVAWDNVTDKPSTYPPAAHTHPEYLGKNETAANANQLNGKSAEYYTNPRNLLDNSDFRNPVNQRGQTSYTGNGNTIDRWNIFSGEGSLDVTLTVNDGYVTIESPHANSGIGQNIPIKNGVYTFAYKVKDGGIIISNGWYSTSIGAYHVEMYVGTGGVLNLEWAALYEGEYTADNLPPYVPKGYAVELAECQRYFNTGTMVFIVYWIVDQTYWASASNKYPTKMRIRPTIEITDVDLATVGHVDVTVDTNDEGGIDRVKATLAAGRDVEGNPLYIAYKASADL